MKKLLMVLGLMVATFIIACNEQGEQLSLNGEANADEYLVFGTFHGYCMPCSNTMYKVTRTALTFDNMEHFPRLDYQFSKDGDKNIADLNNSVQLIDLLPNVLKLTEKEVFGCPDCADQGGYYLEFIYNGETKKILLDKSDSDDQPAEVLNFKNAMSTVIQLIK